MATIIITKNSSTAGAVPLAGDLIQGELAVNVTSKALYTKNASAAVVKLNAPSIVDNGDATAITIDSSENVGIGTSSPSTKFEVNGNITVTDTILVKKTGSYSNINFYDSSSNLLGNLSSDTNSVYLEGRSTYPLRFYTNSSERMRIDSSGNLLVNTTSGYGATKLVVSSDTTTANPLAVINTRSTAATDYSIIFNRNGSIVGSVQTSLSATSYVTSSDYRLKENITPMTGALEKVAQLKPVTYSWKADGSDGQGFIAHELQAVVPDCVTGEKDAVDADGNPVYQGIDTSFLVATLTAAIQELKAEFDAYKATHP